MPRGWRVEEGHGIEVYKVPLKKKYRGNSTIRSYFVRTSIEIWLLAGNLAELGRSFERCSFDSERFAYLDTQHIQLETGILASSMFHGAPVL